jgi:hypothetical protein
MPTQPPSAQFERRDLWFLVAVTAIGVGVELIGIYHYGYIGQDFNFHRYFILTFPQSFSYELSNPVGLYWFVSLIHNHLSATYCFELAALGFLAANVCGLWLMYGFIWQSIGHRYLRFAAAAFITFIPFRLIHSVVIAADAFTLPLFALIAYFTLRIFRQPRHLSSWTGLSASLSVGMLCKYSFAGLLPPLVLLIAIALWRKLAKGERLRWGLAGLLAVALPAGIFLFEMSESAKVDGYSTSRHWLAKNAPRIMRWRDLLTLQKGDAAILTAPEYVRDRVFDPRKYSYMALLHLSSFTDLLGYFQPPPPEIPIGWSGRLQFEFSRSRTALSNSLQKLSARWSLPYSFLALAGVLTFGVLSLRSLLAAQPTLPDATVVLTALAAGYYLLIFLNLPRLADPYGAGYWLPRLVLPALLVFHCLGFALVDFVCTRLERSSVWPKTLRAGFAAYTLVACILFTGFLVG